MVAIVRSPSAKRAREFLEGLGWVTGKPVKIGFERYRVPVRGSGSTSGTEVYRAFWSNGWASERRIYSEIIDVYDDIVLG